MKISDSDLKNLLERHFGRDDFEPGQEEIISSVLSGRDALAITHRKSDQSVCYKLPALTLDGLTLVVSHTTQVVETEDNTFLPATYINSPLSGEHLQKRLRNMEQGGYKLVYAGPEQFRNRAFLSAITGVAVSLLVIEDAHRMSRWSYEFRPDYLDISKAIMEMDVHPPILALAGPCTKRTRDEIRYQLQIHDARIFISDMARSDLSAEVRSVLSPEEKDGVLNSLVPNLSGQGIIYTNTRRQTLEICESMKEYEPRAAIYHGGLGREKRMETEKAFTDGQLRILVATASVSFNAGMDNSRIGWIIHFDMPDRLERYYQQISIAGGDEQPARCILIYSPSDREFHQNIIERNALTPPDIWRIRDVLNRYPKNDVLVFPYGQIELEAAVDRGKLQYVLREMEDAGMLSLLPDCSMQARVRILVKRDELIAEDEADQSVVEWLLENSKSDPGGEILVDFARMRAELLYQHDVLEDCFLALQRSGAISYAPSRKGTALRLIDPDASLTEDTFEKLKASQYDALRVMEEYVHTTQCRQRFLCDYLGDEIDKDCGKCDNCMAAISETELSDSVPLPQYARVAMELVNKAEGRLTKDALARILTGADLQATRFDKWEELGALSMFAPGDIIMMLNLLIGHGFLKEEGETRPPVDLTRKGFRALSGESEPGDAESIASLSEDMKRIGQAQRPKVSKPETDSISTTILHCAEKTDGQVGRRGLMKILRGEKSRKLTKYELDHIDEYAILSYMSKADVLKNIDEMIDRGCLAVTSFIFPMLRLTELGQKRLDRMQEDLR